MRPVLFLLIMIMILACNKTNHEVSSADTIAVDSSSTIEAIEVLPEDDCVFDTSTYEFTSNALAKYNKELSFFWDKESASAYVKLNDTDSLVLHIGGCDHFSYDATFITDSSKFNDQNFLFQKTSWLAKTFFSNGFDDKYVHCIENNLYKEESSQKNYQYYTIADSDTTITDHVYEGWTFKKENAKTIINIAGYIN